MLPTCCFTYEQMGCRFGTQGEVQAQCVTAVLCGPHAQGGAGTGLLEMQ